MYHAGEMEAVLLLDGNDIPVAAHGDQGVLKIFLVVRIVQNMLQLRLDPVPGGQDADAEAAQLDRRRVEDFPFSEMAFSIWRTIFGNSWSSRP